MTPAGQADLAWESIRSRYPAVAGRTYLDTACKGIPSPTAEAAVARHLRRLRESPGASTTDETIVMLDQFGQARAEVAQLIGAHPEEIALVPSTGEGIAKLAANLRLDHRANVIASDLEFIGTVLPWRQLRDPAVDVRLVPHRDGRIEVDDFDAAINKWTAAVVVSSVQEVNGYRVDLDALSAVCQQRGVLLIVDAIQHVGPLPLDVSALPIDALVAGGHKWLCAPFGMGFLYLSERVFDRLRPDLRSFMTASPPKGGWASYLEDPRRTPSDTLTFPSDARQLEAGALGTTLAAAGLAAAVATLNHIGATAIAKRSAGLVATASELLEAVGTHLVTPRTALPSSLVTFRTGTDPERERHLVAALASASVLTSLRYSTGVGGIRVSPYFYNDENDLDRLSAVVARHLKKPRR